MESNKIGIFTNNYMCRPVFTQLLLLTDPFWLQKIITDPHSLAQANIECPDDRYAKLKVCISDMASDS